MMINMKTFKIGYIFLALLAFAISSCEDEIGVTLNPTAEITASASETEVILTKELEGTDVLTLSWPQPEFGFTASPTYMIYLSTTEDFSGTTIAINNGGKTSKTLKSEELNKHLIGLGFEPGEAGSLKIKVIGRLTNDEEFDLESNVVSVTATAYTAFLDLSTTWGVVGSGYNNWGAFPDAPFFTTKVTNELVAYVTLLDGEIKFRENNAWDNNVGDDGGDGTLEANGANIPVTAGVYKIVMNPVAKTYSMSKYSWGIVGSAYNDWGATPDFNFTYDDATDQWRAIVKLKDGEFKIRKNNDWGLNYGDDGANGTLENGGANIAITAGKYLVTFNENELTIEIEPIDHIWGLVGSAYNNWGATPDAQFQRDFKTEDGWILKNVTLLDGEFKIRDANAWDLNYGDDGSDGVLEANGANIPATAGVYTITLDFSDPDHPTYTKVKY
jgi:starch-binding outer membrane protein SusE/F